MNHWKSVAILVLAGVEIAHAAGWAPTSGPTGGHLQTLYINGGTMYASADGGDGYRSTDFGATWTSITATFPNKLKIYGFVSRGGYLLACTGSGIYRSPNEGSTWTLATTGLPISTPAVYGLAANSTTLFAGTDAYGVYRSSNNGASWLPSDGSFQDTGSSCFVVTNDSVFAGTGTGHVRLSTNGGVSWVDRSTGLPLNNYVSGLGILNGILFAGVAGDVVYKSTNKGISWSPASGGLYASEDWRLCSKGGAIYAAAPFRSVLKSTDYGANWVTVGSPSNGLQNNYAISLVADATRIYVGAGGLFISTDDGSSWTKSDTGIKSTFVSSFLSVGTDLYTTTDGSGLFRTANGGNSYSTLNPSTLTSPSIRTIIASPVPGGSTPAILYLANRENKIYRSSDWGASWAMTSNGIPAVIAVSSLACKPSGSFNYHFAGTWDAGVYRSTDEGNSWISTSSGMGAVKVLALLVTNGWVLAGTNTGIWRSPDNGASWSRPFPDTSKLNTSMNVLVTDGSTIYAGSAEGRVFRSTDNGATWVFTYSSPNVTENGPSIGAMALSGGVLLAARDSSILYSPDRGVTWQDVSTGLPAAEIRALQIYNGEVYAGTLYHAVWKRSLSEIVLTPQIQISPSPVAFDTVSRGLGRQRTITISNPGAGTLTITNSSITPSQFSLPTVATSIPAGGSQQFTITLTPTDTGTVNGRAVFFHNAPGDSTVLSLSGRGVAPVWSPNKSSVAFGDVLVGNSVRDTLTVRNQGSSPLVSRATISGNADFTVSPSSPVDVTTLPGALSTYIVSFTPTGTGVRNATVSFAHNAPGSPYPYSASGRGVAPLPSLDRKTIPLGDVQFGSTRTDSFHVSNIGTASLTVVSVQRSDTTVAINPGSATISASTTRAFVVTFRPDVPGDVSKTIILTYAPPAGRDTVIVTARVIAPIFGWSPKSLPFGNVRKGKVSTKPITITNTGTAALNVDGIDLIGASVFAVVPPLTATIAPGSQKDFSVTFSPATEAASTAAVVFRHNAPGSPDTTSLTGTGVAPHFTLTPSSLRFYQVPLNVPKKDSVEVRNDGTDTLNITSVSWSNPAFDVSPQYGVIPNGGSKRFMVTFTASQIDSTTADVTFTHDAGSQGVLHLVGSGVATPLFDVSPVSLHMGYVGLGKSKRDSVKVTNKGGGILNVGPVSCTNTLFVPQQSSAALATNESKWFVIAFSPSSRGDVHGQILFPHNAPRNPDSVSIDGTGVAPFFAADSTSLTFGSVVIPGPAYDTLVVQNTGDDTLHLGAPNVGGGPGFSTQTSVSVALSPGAKYSYRCSFTPADTGAKAGTLTITHDAAGSPFTANLTGRGVRPEFRFSHVSMVFGAVMVGATVGEIVNGLITNPGGAPLTISSITSSNPAVFKVASGGFSVPAGGSHQVPVEFVPDREGLLSGNLTIQHNAAVGSTVVQLTGVGASTPHASPVLRSPSSGATGQPVLLSLAWDSVSGATKYWLKVRVSDSSSTARVVVNDSTLTVTNRQISQLARSSRFWWTAAAGNRFGWGPFAGQWSFSTVQSENVSSTVAFPADPQQKDYRTFSIPGTQPVAVSGLMAGQGEHKKDWRIVEDLGTAGSWQDYYRDVGTDQFLYPGRGYWILSKKSITFTRDVTMPPLSSGGSAKIAFHAGWNLFGIPFNVPVSRAGVLSANNLGSADIWEQTGASSGHLTGDLQPFKAYYLMNTAGLDSLSIPYPFPDASTSSQIPGQPSFDWKIELVLSTPTNEDRDNYIGISPVASQEKDALDQYKPPPAFDAGSLSFPRLQWDSAYTRFASDIRPRLKEGQSWDFEVSNPRLSESALAFHGLEGIPEGLRVLLVSLGNTVPVDLRNTPEFTFMPISSRMQFRVLIGTPAYVESELAKLLPTAYVLDQNYPNPFNAVTMLRYEIPEPSRILLTVYSMLGQEVKTLVDGIAQPGTYTVRWDGTNTAGRPVASGVYLARLMAGQRVVRVLKMTMVR